MLAEFDGLPGVAELDSDADGVDGDVGRPEFRALVVSVLPELPGGIAGGLQMLEGFTALVIAGGGG